MDPVTLESLKARWNDVLDDLESTNRTAWMAVFDGRLARVLDDVLTLDFSDATKMAGGHGFERAGKPQFAVALEDSIERVTGARVTVLVATGA